MRRKDRYKAVIDYFIKNKPVAETELVFDNPFQLIVAVILSAQCTDKRVNLITPELFKKFPDARSLSELSPDEIFPFIKSCSYPNSKSKYISGMAKMLMDQFGGVVPSDIEDLQKLPGVGRKTANVIASVVFNKPAMAVDTHVFRVSARIGLTINAKTPLAAEQQLVANIPENLIPLAHHWLILHGRYICLARSPKCKECGLSELCKYYLRMKK